MKTPRINPAALEGICRALNYLQCEDLTDDTDQEEAEMKAADEWIRKVYAANRKTVGAEPQP